MSILMLRMIAVIFLASSISISAQIERYVSPEGSATYPYTNWATAALDIWTAVSAANSNDALDTVWVTNGHYMIENTIVVSNVKVRGWTGNDPPDPSKVIVDGGGAHRCFYLKHVNSELSGLTITNGYLAGNEPGAGILIEVMDAGTIVISNCVITGNSSQTGGVAIISRIGADDKQGILDIYDSHIIGNSENGISNWWTGEDNSHLRLYRCHVAHHPGIGIAGNIMGVVVVDDCVIYNNGSSGVYSYGGWYCYIYNSVVTNNSGYGIYKNAYGTPTFRITNSLVANNASGGVRLRQFRQTALIDSSIIRGNSGTGGLLIETGNRTAPYTFTISNTLITDNTNTANDGGGVRMCIFSADPAAGEIIFRNSTIANNHSGGDGGGLWSEHKITNSFYNTIIYGNTAVGDHPDIGFAIGEIMKFSHSCSPTLPDENGNITGDPIFIDSAAGNYRLRGNSPCIGTGDLLNWTANNTDLEGNPRLFRGLVDMGCYQHRYVRGTIFQVDGL